MQWDQRVIVAVLAAFSHGSALFGGSAVCVQETLLTPLTPVPNQLFGRSVCGTGPSEVARPLRSLSMRKPSSAACSHFAHDVSAWL